MVMTQIYWPGGEATVNIPSVPRLGDFFTIDAITYKVKEVSWGFVRDGTGKIIDGKISAAISLGGTKS